MKHVVGDEQDAQAEAAPESDAAVISRVFRAPEVDDRDVADLLRRAAVRNRAALDRLAQ
jgi:hypothetical protein